MHVSKKNQFTLPNSTHIAKTEVIIQRINHANLIKKLWPSVIRNVKLHNYSYFKRAYIHQISFRSCLILTITSNRVENHT
jgi:hypothetical protein